MSIFNCFEFDGVNSFAYGVFVTGKSVYDAPSRDVESVSVPGRNGDILIDKGRFKNIDITYHCGCFAANKFDFARKVAAFRSMLMSI